MPYRVVNYKVYIAKGIKEKKINRRKEKSRDSKMLIKIKENLR